MTNKQAMEHLSHDYRDSTAGNWLAAKVSCRPGPRDQRDGNVQNSGLPEAGLTSYDMSDDPIQQIKGRGQSVGRSQSVAVGGDVSVAKHGS